MMNLSATIDHRCRWLLSLAFLLSASQAPSADAQNKLPRLGVLDHEPGAFDGYTLVSPLSCQTAFLLDMKGQVAHSWETDCRPGMTCYLRPDGSLMRAGRATELFQFPQRAGGGGRIQIYDWDGTLTWDYQVATPYRMSHHDIAAMPNGNVLVLCWEVWQPVEVIAAGRRPEIVNQQQFWAETIYEVKPKGLHGAELIWSWSVVDHLVQDHDPAGKNYGDVAKHPELIDINLSTKASSDWAHMNAIDYNPQRDEIMMCSRTFGELWVIDHSATREEARGHSGGARGHGGDLLYRWGNPQNFKRGTKDDQKLFGPHDAHWIPEGLPGAGRILVFNNGQVPDRKWSQVLELQPPLDERGNYLPSADDGYGPAKPEWLYEDRDNFYSARISGSQRLPNGNTLICSGTQHTLLEVSPDGTKQWRYVNAPRYHSPPRARAGELRVSLLSDADQARLQEQIGIPLKDGGTLFRATRFAADASALSGRLKDPAVP